MWQFGFFTHRIPEEKNVNPFALFVLTSDSSPSRSDKAPVESAIFPKNRGPRIFRQIVVRSARNRGARRANFGARRKFR